MIPCRRSCCCYESITSVAYSDVVLVAVLVTAGLVAGSKELVFCSMDFLQRQHYL
jgi:hypothetical protein